MFADIVSVLEWVRAVVSLVLICTLLYSYFFAPSGEKEGEPPRYANVIAPPISAFLLARARADGTPTGGPGNGLPSASLAALIESLAKDR